MSTGSGPFARVLIVLELGHTSNVAVRAQHRSLRNKAAKGTDLLLKKQWGKMPMAVRVELTPLLRKYIQGYDPDKGLIIEDGEGKAVRQIIKELGIPSDKVFAVLINHLPSQPSYVLKDGDLVTLSMVLGGG